MNVDIFTTKLNEVDSIWLGIEYSSSLGFRVSYDNKNNYYQVDLSLYATEDDWRITLDYLSALAKIIGNSIEEGNNKFTAQEILNIDYKPVMELGVTNLLSRIEDYELTLYGIKRPIIFGNILRDELKSSTDKIKLLSEILYSCQYPPAYVHQQTFHFNNGGKTLFGNYSIGENLKSILPRYPFVEIYNEKLLVGHPLTHWTMSVTKLDDNKEYQLHKVCEYSSFFNNIPLEKFSILDDNFVVVAPLSLEELENIVSKSEVIDRYAQFNE